jgi:hypothetical protein
MHAQIKKPDRSYILASTASLDVRREFLSVLGYVYVRMHALCAARPFMRDTMETHAYPQKLSVCFPLGHRHTQKEIRDWSPAYACVRPA